MKIPKVTTIDFETFKIEGRPSYPPIPVSVSIKEWGKKPQFYSWGHPSGNNCKKADAVKAVKKAYANPDGILCHNAKFDVDVAETHLKIKPPSWQKIHETVFLLFLDNPHGRDYGLKPSAKRVLGIDPEERDTLVEWLRENYAGPDGKKITSAKAGEYIAYAPGVSVVGPYADGDVKRTELLFRHLYPKIVETGMLRAYQREQELMPILLDMERRGVRVDIDRLRADVKTYQEIRVKIDAWVRKRLKCGPDVNLQSGSQLLAAMEEAGVVDTSLMPLTKKAKKTSTNKVSLALGVTDKQLASVLAYDSQLHTCLSTFMEPWLATAEKSGGLIFTYWNQTPSEKGGARTGRLSSTPNFQNIPKEFAALFAHDEATLPKAERKGLPKSPFALPPLPMCRSYVVPMEKDHVLAGRDYCFSGDTEILTEGGFTRFDQLKKTVRVAQWKDGEISFVNPSDYQKVPSFGNLTRIVGERSCDLLVTPSHNCLVRGQKDELKKVPAINYPAGKRHQQLHAGILNGSLQINPTLVKFVVALQADATIKGGTRIVWKLKKTRKLARLESIFAGLGLDFQKIPTTDGQWSVATRVDRVPEITGLIDLKTKTFTRKWLEVRLEGRLIFLRELGHWDGSVRIRGDSWVYHTTNEINAELAVELAAVSGMRTVTSSCNLPSGKKFTTVNLRSNGATWTDTYKVSEEPHGGMVYCVTVPSGIIIVRRNGRVAVTGQSQQEPRILAHFEDGALLAQYQANPWIDYHDNAKEHLERIFRRPFKRKPVKNINLGIIYGQGVASLALKNDESYEETKNLKNAIFEMYPGLKDMYSEMRRRAKAGEPITTWGGRVYYCEPPAIVNGKIMEFDYKMVNVLIQGSASDCTKEGMIRYYKIRPENHFLLMSVHDELVLSCPANELVWGLELLRQAMESVEFEVKILSEGAWSAKNWAQMADYDKKGKTVANSNIPPQRKVAS